MSKPRPHTNLQIETQASAASLRATVGIPPPSPTVSDGSSAGNIRVVVRVRGINAREAERGANCLVEIDPHTQTTHLYPPTEGDKSHIRKIFDKKSFTFDNSFWSGSPTDPHYATQEHIYDSLGEEFLDHNFAGYHTCIFAYGQTGSGKSYTMMGVEGNPGLIPRTCEDLFERIEVYRSPDVSYSVRVSYFEIYNEQVRDLLAPRTETPRYLKVRESPTEGPYVTDLIELPVKNYAEVKRFIELGDQSRTTASTKMNDTSSRSHAVFTLMLRQVHHDVNTDETTERVGRMRLVDLAGSERANATGATGARLREGGNINKSLTTLGRVIATLASSSTSTNISRSKKEVVPYRDSILTWLLKDSLGGNSKTAMIACISPTDYDETLSTLRYADQAKHIKTRATVNEDQVSSAIRDAQVDALQETIRSLQLKMAEESDARQSKEHEIQNRQLAEYQNQVTQMQRLMEEQQQVAEVKIKSLQTQNETLRLHLKLAVEGRRFSSNPVGMGSEVGGGLSRNNSTLSRNSSLRRAGSVKKNLGGASAGGQLQQSLQMEDEGLGAESEFGSEDEWDDFITEIEIRCDDVLKRVGSFKRKAAEDKARFMLNSLHEKSVNEGRRI
ncbi:kinesin-domain-containing protein [Terfezia boudieri ATCC MYA-4762]|uniref:Kinesin-like protein n=1 Tax=Terfezia boudieri ATCC MYA-4762 TaxID=1051890 RepID=A0A3N4LYT1_9PEZI|nr:kinesin-domain-containing protein [Terfezia boudieri ATCC MYA-4762]